MRFDMKKIAVIVIGFLIVMFGFMLVNSCETIRPGFVGVSIRKCGGDGVSEKPIPTGYYFRTPFCEEVMEYPTSMKTIILTNQEGEGHPELDQAISVPSSQSLSVDFDISLSFTINPVKIPAIYKKFRAGVDVIAITYMRQTIREALRQSSVKYTVEQLNSDKQEIVRAETQETLTKILAEEGFIVQQFTINKVHIPKQITEAINAKVAMSQQALRAEAEVQKKTAEGNQNIAEARGLAEANRIRAESEANATLVRAEAQAKANKLLAESITPTLIDYEQARKWNGVLPGVTGGAVPYINVK